MSEYDPTPAPRQRREDEDEAYDRWRDEREAEWEALVRGRAPTAARRPRVGLPHHRRMPPLFRPITAAEWMRYRRRTLVLALVAGAMAIASGMLSGCAAPDGYWVRTTEPLRAVHAPQPDYPALLRACGFACQAPGCVLYGCARRYPIEGFCAIYTEPDPPAWVYRHEMAHCMGWDHPGTTRLLLSEWPEVEAPR